METKYSYWCFRGVLSKKEINKIKRISTKSGYSNGVTRGDDLSVKKEDLRHRNTDVAFSDNQWLYDTLCPFVNGANKNSGWNFDIDWFEPVQIARYGKSQHYSWHHDGGSDIHGAYKEGENLKGKVRKLSLVAILSNGYLGGELEFSLQDNKSEILNAEMNIGDVIVFPSFICHRSTPITKGKKYSASMWCLGPPFK